MTLGSWAIVTGASSGIGEAFARRLASDGHRLVLAARRRDRLERLQAELGGEVRVVEADLSTGEGRDRLWEVVESLDRPAAMLVNNAGFGLRGPLAVLDRALQLQMIELNVVALTDLAHRYVSLRGATGGGVLINVASVVGFRPMPHMAVYAATKSYVVSLTRALAEEVRGTGMQVLALCPGPVPTEFQSVAGSSLDRGRRAVAVSAAQVVDEALQAVSLGAEVWVPGGAMRAVSRVLRLFPLRITSWIGRSWSKAAGPPEQ
jgi:hypothetical protein